MWWLLITNSSTPSCFFEMYLMCFCLMHTVCLYLAIQNSHLHFVPAVRLSLWVHRVWRTRLTMEGGGSQQSWHLHRPPRSSPRHSVQWVSLSHISSYSFSACPHFVLKSYFVNNTSLPYLIASVSCRDAHLSFPHAAFSCSEGEFLDMQSQQCQKCAAGTYSLGTSIAFDEWDRLPFGFVTHGVNTDGEDVPTDCSKSVYI